MAPKNIQIVNREKIRNEIKEVQKSDEVKQQVIALLSQDKDFTLSNIIDAIYEKVLSKNRDYGQIEEDVKALIQEEISSLLLQEKKKAPTQLVLKYLEAEGKKKELEEERDAKQATVLYRENEQDEAEDSTDLSTLLGNEEKPEKKQIERLQNSIARDSEVFGKIIMQWVINSPEYQEYHRSLTDESKKQNLQDRIKETKANLVTANTKGLVDNEVLTKYIEELDAFTAAIQKSARLSPKESYEIINNDGYEATALEVKTDTEEERIATLQRIIEQLKKKTSLLNTYEEIEKIDQEIEKVRKDVIKSHPDEQLYLKLKDELEKLEKEKEAEKARERMSLGGLESTFDRVRKIGDTYYWPDSRRGNPADDKPWVMFLDEGNPQEDLNLSQEELGEYYKHQDKKSLRDEISIKLSTFKSEHPDDTPEQLADLFMQENKERKGTLSEQPFTLQDILGVSNPRYWLTNYFRLTNINPAREQYVLGEEEITYDQFEKLHGPPEKKGIASKIMRMLFEEAKQQELPSAQNEKTFLAYLKETLLSFGKNDGEQSEKLFARFMFLKMTYAPHMETKEFIVIYDYLLQLGPIIYTLKNDLRHGWQPEGVPATGEAYQAEFIRDKSFYDEVFELFRSHRPDLDKETLNHYLLFLSEHFEEMHGSNGIEQITKIQEKDTQSKELKPDLILYFYQLLLDIGGVDKLKYIAKFIRAENDWKKIKLKVIRFVEGQNPIPPPEPPADLDFFRRHYADRRRSLGKFLDRADGRDVDEARDRYTTQYRNFLTANLQTAFAGRNLNLPEEKQNLARTVVDAISNERRALLQTEIELQRRPLWEKFKTFWRKHPVARMGISAGLLTSSIVLASASAPLAVGAAVAFAGWNALSTNIGIEGLWEGVRNRFGRTRNRSATQVAGMGQGEVQNRLAAHSTLITSQKPGYDNTDHRLPPNAVQQFRDLFNFNSYPVARRETAETIWNRQNEIMNAAVLTVLTALPAGSPPNVVIATAVTEAMNREIALMQETENRENAIRRNNIYKKLTALAGGLIVGGLTLWATLPHQAPPAPHTGPTPAPGTAPTPTPTHAPGTTPGVPPAPAHGPALTTTPGVPPTTPTVPPVAPSATPSGDLYFTMPESIPTDVDPGLFQALAYKLGVPPSTMNDPSLLHMFSNVHANAGLADTSRTMIDAYGHTQTGLNFLHGGDKLQLSQDIINRLSTLSGKSATEVIRRITS